MIIPHLWGPPLPVKGRRWYHMFVKLPIFIRPKAFPVPLDLAHSRNIPKSFPQPPPSLLNPTETALLPVHATWGVCMCVQQPTLAYKDQGAASTSQTALGLNPWFSATAVPAAVFAEPLLCAKPCSKLKGENGGQSPWDLHSPSCPHLCGEWATCCV